MMARLLDILFGCRHKHLTRPITTVHRPGTPAGLVYCSCLDCGKKFHYDVATMKVGAPVESPSTRAFDPFSVPSNLVRDPLSSR